MSGSGAPPRTWALDPYSRPPHRASAAVRDLRRPGGPALCPRPHLASGARDRLSPSPGNRAQQEREPMAIIDAGVEPRTPFEQDVAATQRYFDSPRFEGIVRLYTARQVVEQRGTIPADYIVAREAATAFYARLRELFAEGKSITSFGPYSPGQAVAMKRMGIE